MRSKNRCWKSYIPSISVTTNYDDIVGVANLKSILPLSTVLILTYNDRATIYDGAQQPTLL
jgi:hypothetical protein